MPLFSAIAFQLYYAAVAAVCGALAHRACQVPRLRCVQPCDPPNPAASPDLDTARSALAAFLVGSGLAPFVVALLSSLLWTLLPGRPRWLYLIPQWLIVAAACAVLWPDLRALGRDLRCVARSYRRTWPILAPVLVVVGMVCITCILATRPIAGYDAATYALDARRVAHAQSASALMPLAPTPADPQFANHNHGASFQLYLAASLQYAADPVQDFPLRLAIDMLGAHVFLVVLGLAWSLSTTAAVLAVFMLLCYRGFGWLMGAYSRDLYRLLPLLVLLGLCAHPRPKPGIFSLHSLLTLAAMCFLWNSHVSSLMIAPLAVGCIAITSGSLKQALTTAAIFVLSIPLGAFRLLAATLETGSPTGRSPFYNTNYEGTAVIAHWWKARGTLPAGWCNLPQRLSAQLTDDGTFLVLILWAALVLLAVWTAVSLARRSRLPRPPRPILTAGLFLLLSQLLLGGLLDCVSGSISTAMSMNFRYRSHFYPLAAVIVGYLLSLLVHWLSTEREQPAAIIFGLLLGFVAIQTIRPDLPNVSAQRYRLDAYANRRLLAADPIFRWLGEFYRIPPDQLILMDYAYLGWYHTDNRIVFTQDPRVRPAFAAATPADALKTLDDLGVRYVYLIDLEARAILDSDIPLARVLKSGAFELVDRIPTRWYLLRRTATPADSNLLPTTPWLCPSFQTVQLPAPRPETTLKVEGN